MNQQEQATKHAAIFQDTINGTNDPTPWPVTMWASSGDTIWTAGTARTAGEDSVGMIYDPGDTIVHRNTIAGDVTRATESFAIRPADGQSPMDAMLAGIEQWNHRHPDRWDTVATPGQYRMTDPTQARSKTTDRPTVEQYVPEGGKTPDAIGDETPAPPRKTETDMATKQRQGPIVPASQSPAAGPERRHTDLKSTLDRFRTRLKKNLDGLNADPPTAGTDRNRGQRKTL